MILDQDRYTPSLAMKRKDCPIRLLEPCAIVVHTTGWGIIRRSQRSPTKYPTPLAAALHVYTRVMPYSGHFVVDGESGEWHQVVPMNYVASHVGARGLISEAVVRRAGERKKHTYKWWTDKYPHLTSPKDLAFGMLWDGGSCNYNTVGIEVTPHPAGIGHPWSRKAVRTLHLLAHLIQDSFATLELAPQTVLSHSECGPRGRTTGKGKPWDPNKKVWNERVRKQIIEGI